MNIASLRLTSVLMGFMMAMTGFAAPRAAQAQGFQVPNPTQCTGFSCPGAPPPLISVLPASSSMYGPNDPVHVTLIICSQVAFIWSVTYNGTTVTTKFAGTTVPNTYVSACNPVGMTVYDTATFTVAPGSNSLVVTAQNASGQTTQVVSTSTWVSPKYGVLVTANDPTENRDVTTGYSEGFTVRNVGGLAANYTLTPSCAGAALASSPCRR
jgi:hypothetical protein